MDKTKHVLQVCAYSADYGGNFIASLLALESRLLEKGYTTIYAFPRDAADKEWCKQIQKRTKVYFLPVSKARIRPQTYYLFLKIYSENNIVIAHSHFELYDIPMTVTAPSATVIFWHLHDPIVFGHGLRKQLWLFQYGVVGKRAVLLSVSDYFRKKVEDIGFPKENTYTILNGISLDRIQKAVHEDHKMYDFLAFGWDFFRKGDDLLLGACQELYKEGYRFHLLLNGNDHTWPILNEFLNGEKPEWLSCCEPVEDVSALFNQTGAFVQASRRETFSYALCEAVYAGLPAVCSDIAGLEWAHSLPAVVFFENENKTQLKEALRAILDHKTVGQDAIEKSRDIIRANYSIDSWAGKVLEFYNAELRKKDQCDYSGI